MPFKKVAIARSGHLPLSKRLGLLCGALVLLLTTSTTSWAGGLAISPQRVILEGRARHAELMLMNESDKSVTYSIYFKHRRMLEDGSFVEIDEPGPDELFAAPMLRYSPRRVTLEPYGKQSVRLIVRKPKGLADGEYRSRLVFESLPDADDGQTLDKLTQKEGELSVKIIARYSVSIPVVVRHGQTQVDAAISEPKLIGAADDAPAKLALRLNRSGNRSVTGNLQVNFIPERGEPITVGELNGVSVLSPYPSRIVEIPLPQFELLATDRGRWQVDYRSRPNEGERLLASAEWQTP